MSSFWVYMLQCVDGSYYVGHTDQLDIRMRQHEAGTFPDGYTSERRPLELVWFAELPTRDEALAREHQLKGWSRKKKLALIENDWARIKEYSKGRERPERASTPALRASAQRDRK